MRRGKQALEKETCRKILTEGITGVLALAGDEGYPYAVPINYYYDGDSRLYFHCAKSGHKIDAVARDPKASFCVVALDTPVPERFSTDYRSVIAFGKMRVVEDPEEMRRAIRLFTQKYSPAEPEEKREKEIEAFWKSLCILELQVEHLTGKEALRLRNQAGHAT